MRVDDRVPVVVGHLEEHVVADDPGAGDEDVQGAALRHRRVDGRLDVLPLRHVAAHGGPAERRGGLIRSRLVEVRDDDRRPFVGEPLRRGGADPLRAARHERRLALESRHRTTLYGASMELREILAKRRMHRSFDAEPLPRDQIERVVGVIRRAPSGGFSQGGSIVVVTDPDLRARIADAFGDEHYSHGGRNFIADAPVHLVISANEQLYHDRYNQPDKLAATGGVEITWPVPYWFVDAGALMMLVLAAAIDEGLASAFIGHPDQKQIFDDLLGLPRDVIPIGLAVIG